MQKILLVWNLANRFATGQIISIRQILEKSRKALGQCIGW